jgi:adenosine deaminase
MPGQHVPAEPPFAALPKVELHCHLDGLVDPAMLRDLRRRGQPLAVAPEALEAAYPVRDLASFVRWGHIAEPLEGDLEAFKPILALHLERLTAQHVVYTEVMIAPSEIPRDPGEAVDKVRALRAWTANQARGAIQVEFLACCNRKRDAEAVADLGRRILRLYDEGLVVGVALAGPEAGHPVKPFARTFAAFHEAGLGIEIHAGEWCGPESVWDALHYGYPNRIGHGVSAFQDPRLIETIRGRGIHVEMCPTSNVSTGSVASIDAHPIARARALGLSIGVNTDDPGAFACSMTGEYAVLADVFSFGADDFAYLYTSALAARFGKAPP